MGTKLKDRIVEWTKKNDIKAFDWKSVAIAFGVPRGSATGRLCELAKAGVLEREGRQYRVKGSPAVRTKTAYYLLLDASTSMSHDNPRGEDRRPEAARLANDSAQAVIDAGGNDEFSVGLFAGDVQWLPRTTGNPNISKEYPTRPTGTALCYALVQAIERAKNQVCPKVVLCFTDGEENQSIYNGVGWEQLKAAIASAPDDLTVAILVPEGSNGHRLLKDAGIPAGNIRPWRTMEQARTETVASTTAYAEARKRGVRSTKNYFKADLSRTTIVDFERDLKEITSEISKWVAQKETTTEAIISEKTKRDYVPGTGFFEVMKREGRIKGDRRFLILEPSTGRCFADGRRTVRQVCGYPEGDVAIKPGNHAGFVLLCQSKSSSKDTFRARILPRGTTVVYWANGR